MRTRTLLANAQAQLSPLPLPACLAAWAEALSAAPGGTGAGVFALNGRAVVGSLTLWCIVPTR